LRGAFRDIPTWDMLRADEAELAARASAFAARVGGAVVPGETLVGGGSAPEAGIASPLVVLACESPDTVATRLRAQDPPVVARTGDGALLLDLRTVASTDDDLLAKLVTAALGR